MKKSHFNLNYFSQICNPKFDQMMISSMDVVYIESVFWQILTPGNQICGFAEK